MKKLLIYLNLLAVVLSCSLETNPYTFSVNVNSSPGGSVKGVSSTPKESFVIQTYENNPLTVSAVPDREYVFTGWTGYINSTENPLTFEADKNYNTTLTANFILKKYPLTIAIEGEGSVTEEIVDSGRSTDYSSGTTVRLTAVPADEWLFTGWTGAVTSSNNSVELTITEAKEVTATFVKKRYPLTVEVVGEGSVSEEIVSTEKATDYDSGTVVRLTATPEDEWLFAGWTGAVTSSETEVELSITEAKTVTATFVKKQYPLTVNVVGEGSVTEEIVVANKATDYDSGTTVKLTAIPATGWQFIEWSGASTATNPVIEVTITEPQTFTATFNKTPVIYLDSNGVTVKSNEMAVVGDTGDIEGVTYTVVDAATLEQMIENEEDVSKVVTTKITNMQSLFDGKTSFNQDISSWDVSNVTSISLMFKNAAAFNQDIANWNTANVTQASNAFNGASSFNQDISSWDMSKCVNMNYMFKSATDFNQPIGSWNTSNVAGMSGVFQFASSFNQDVSSWVLDNVTQTASMFNGASVFNQDVSSFNMAKVTNMNYMFKNASVFNQDIGGWDITSIPDASKMAGVFNNALVFNQDLTKWCVSNITSKPNGFSTGSALSQANEPVWGSCPGDEVVPPITLDANGVTLKASPGTVAGDTGQIDGVTYTIVDDATLAEMVGNGDDLSKVVTTLVTTLKDLFKNNGSFNQDISSWDTSNVVNIAATFQNASSFNQDISAWNTSKVRQAYNTFNGASVFNQDIGSWDMGSVTNMNYMLNKASAFNQDIGDWDVSSIPDASKMAGTLYNTTVFNQDLTGWCVSNIASKPTNFSNNSALTAANEPVWGTCPN